MLSKNRSGHPQLSHDQPSSSIYVTAQRRQHYQRLRRWLSPLLPPAERARLRRLWRHLTATPTGTTDVALLITRLLSWPLRTLRRLSLSQLLALGLTTGLLANGLSQPLITLAQEPVGDEFQVNTYTTSAQTKPVVAMDAEGDFIIAWQSWQQDGSNNGVFAQRYDKNGNPLGSEFQVNSHTTGDQSWVYASVDAAMDADGDFIITWPSGNYSGIGQDGSEFGVFAQRYDKDGHPLGSEFQVNMITDHQQSNPDVAIDEDGDFVIAWQSHMQDGSYYGIFARRYDKEGHPLGSEFQVNTYTSGYQIAAEVAIDQQGNFVIAWVGSGTDTNQDGSSSGIFARRYDKDGHPLSDEFQVNTYTTGSQGGSVDGPAIGMDVDGNFIIAWPSGNYYNAQDGSGSGIFAQRYDKAGNPIGTEFQVNTFTTGYQGSFGGGPGVGMDADGDFVIAWQSGDYGNPQDGSFRGVFAQRYDKDGFPVGSEFQVNTYTTGPQGSSLAKPGIGMDQDGDFVIAWQSGNHNNTQDGSREGIFAQRFIKSLEPEIAVSGDGTAIADGAALPTAANLTDFGQILLGSSLTHTFTISNTGDADLNLTGTPAITLSGAATADFSVTQQPTTPISANGGSTTFQIRFTPTLADMRAVIVTIPNDDPNEAPYDFAIQGTGTSEMNNLTYLPLIVK